MCLLGQELHNSCWVFVTCLAWGMIHCIGHSLVVAPSLLVIILDCTSILLLGGIVGHIELHEGVSSWHPMCEILLNGGTMPGDLVVGLGCLQILH